MNKPAGRSPFARGGRDSNKDSTRINEDITAPEVRLVGSDGEMVGVVPIQKALELASDAGFDLVEVSPNAAPPVCKILDYGKFRYEQQKKAAEARKNQKTIDIKEIKMRPTIEKHDYEVKLRNAKRFIEDGDKVKFTIRFRGREAAHQSLGLDVLKRIQEELAEVTKVDFHPKMEGRQMIMILSPDTVAK